MMCAKRDQEHYLNLHVAANFETRSRPREKVDFLSHHHPANVPGKSLITLLVTLPPNGATPPHSHSNAAIIATMIQGTALNQMNSDEPFSSSSGDTFYEAPGCHHVRSENLSETEGASFSAVFIIDDEVVENGYDQLMVLDAEK